MIIHPVRMTGMVIGVPQTYDYFKKIQDRIVAVSYTHLLEGIYPDLAPQRTLLAELISKMQYQQLRPKTIVDYIREPFIFTAGNVRVTLDRGIRTGTVNGVQALTSLAVTIPAGTQGPLLEVKYDEFLPEIIRDIVQLGSRQAGAFSKYAACRIYG